MSDHHRSLDRALERIHDTGRPTAICQHGLEEARCGHCCQDEPTAEYDAGPEYRIEFSITRRLPGEDDFTEIGFGSSGAWGSVDQASHMTGSAIECREWETGPGMPRPSEVDR